jgi:hypothetical protein
MSVLANVELCFWNLDAGDPPRVSVVRERLADHDLNPERAPDVAPATAFRRAVEAARSKEVLARVYTRQTDSLLCAQLDLERQEGHGLQRRRLAIYQLEEGVVRLVEGAEQDGLHDNYAAARATYTWADVSKVIQAILLKDGLGAYSPRKSGGVYFVPVKPEAADLLARIERFAGSLGVRFLRYQVPDTEAQRHEIADAIAHSFEDELAAHEAAIAGYTPETRPGVVQNRRLAVAQTAALMERLQPLLVPGGIHGRVAQLLVKVHQLGVQLDAVEAAIAAYAPAPRGRRIVTTPTLEVANAS